MLGIPDVDRGEMVVAFVVPKDPADPPTMPDVREHCKSVGLMMQKIPERIEIIDVMPRNPSGKVPKHELRARISRPARLTGRRVEEALLRGVVVGGVLGVPLHREHERAVDLERLDDAVVRRGRRRAGRRRAARSPDGGDTTR